MITEEQFNASMVRMAGVVDGQNASDPSYQPMVTDGQPSGNAYQAAWKLVRNGVAEPGGYTEPGLQKSRLSCKDRS